MEPYWVRAARFCGIQLNDVQMDQMERYAFWLRTEGVRAGAIGPAEPGRLDRRHLADSVLFAGYLHADPTEAVWDLGTGVGLPGIPLAITLPGRRFLLIDRSRRRIDLTRRALRILGLENCQVMQGEIADLTGEVATMVTRASLPPDRLLEVGDRHLRPDGVMVAGGSWQEAPQQPGWTSVEIPRDVLDQPVWLLIMRRE